MPETPSTVIDAARALLGVCDGARTDDRKGFNGPDSEFVRSMMSRRWLTVKQMTALHRCLHKYRKQLSQHGLDYDTLTIPEQGPKTSATGSCRSGESSPDNSPSEAPPKREPEKAACAAPAPFPYKGPVPTLDEFLGGFPLDMFPSMRPAQRLSLERIHKAWFIDGKKYAILEAPTGIGKSPVGFSAARYFQSTGQDTYFLTIQNLLIDQYLRDFPAPAMEFCKGRGNFPCTHPNAGDDMDAAHGVCKAQKRGILQDCLIRGSVIEAVTFQLPPECHRCPYWEQLTKCINHPIVLFNFSSYLFQRRIGRFPHASLLLIDEAHNVEGQLMNYVQLSLSQYALDIINVEIDRQLTTKEQVVEWLREKEVQQRILDALGNAEKNRAMEEIPVDLSVAETDALRELQDKIGLFLQNLDKTDWVISTETVKGRHRTFKKILARPLWAKDFAEDLLFSCADKVLLMSATILDKQVFCTNLGINLDDAEFIQVESDFPPENRPIHLDYAGPMSHKTFNETIPKFIRKIKEILKRHKGQRGIIHSHSFKITNILREEINDPRFLFQVDFPDKKTMLEEHARREDSVIVAPAMHEGLDLKDDLGRFQIVAKIPYPDMNDKVVKERMSRDRDWYGWLTALKFVQELGRIVRSKSDWGITYVTDSNFDLFGRMNARMIPDWIKPTIVKGAPKEVRRD